jgi:trehalose 6-phosphate phosphatase
MRRPARLTPARLPGAVFLDYDGTLVDIRERPGEARLHPRRRDLLARLTRSTLVAIVSGRPLDELRRFVGVGGAAYVGNHGMEIRLGRTVWVHPKAARRAPMVARTAAAIGARVSGLPGVIVEDKGLTASVHYRLCPPRARGLLRAVAEKEVGRSRGALVLTQGKMVLEIRPDIGWDKGRGVLKLMDLAGCPASCVPVYIGDDRTDEDAFRALAGRGLTIHVGRRGPTEASRRFRDVKEVWRFLRAISGLPPATPDPGRNARR